MDICRGYFWTREEGGRGHVGERPRLETAVIEMDGEESIYSLIPKEYVPPPKPKRYRSKFPAETMPTGSTLA